jgi:hypothetical protein
MRTRARPRRSDAPLAARARTPIAIALVAAAAAAVVVMSSRSPREASRDRGTVRAYGSAYRRRASAMLGWLLADVGELAEAERRFRAALDDPSSDVGASARAGLDALVRAGAR